MNNAANQRPTMNDNDFARAALNVASDAMQAWAYERDDSIPHSTEHKRALLGCDHAEQLFHAAWSRLNPVSKKEVPAQEDAETFGDPCPHGLVNVVGQHEIVSVCRECLESVREKAWKYDDLCS